MTEIQVSDLDTNTEIEDNDSSGCRHLPEIAFTSEDSNSDETEWLDQTFYQSIHTVSNWEYAKLKLSHFAVKLQNSEPIIALSDTGPTCSCISFQLYTKKMWTKWIL